MADLSTSTGPLQGSSTHFIGSSANHYTGTGSELPWDTPSQSLGVSADGLSPTPYNSSRDYYHVYTGEDPGRPHTILHRLLSTPSELHTYDSMYENGTSGWALNHTQGLLGNASLSSEPSPSGLAGDISLGVLLGALSMLTFVGNAMVLHAVRTEKRLQTVRLNLWRKRKSCHGDDFVSHLAAPKVVMMTTSGVASDEKNHQHDNFSPR